MPTHTHQELLLVNYQQLEGTRCFAPYVDCQVSTCSEHDGILLADGPRGLIGMDILRHLDIRMSDEQLYIYEI